MLNYAPLDVLVTTPRLELAGASDDLLQRLEPVVRAGKTAATPAPYDDPMSLYEEDPDVRVRKWLQGIWRGRGSQDLIGDQFSVFGTVTSFSWLSSDLRGRGLGGEMRQAILHLAFEGLAATEATTEAFLDNPGSNGVSRATGYSENGLTWATRRGEPGLMQSWRINRADWIARRRSDIRLHGVDECKEALELE